LSYDDIVHEFSETMKIKAITPFKVT